MNKTIALNSIDETIAILGNMNQRAMMMRDLLGVVVEASNDGIIVTGTAEEIAKAENVIMRLVELVRRKATIDNASLRYLCECENIGKTSGLDELFANVIVVSAKGRPVVAKTVGQQRYIKAMTESECTFAVGPAGTGKTYLAVAMAVKAFKSGAVSRIILTRPAVEAGENLGFLPGDLQMKVDPYMRPLYDALYDLMGMDAHQKYIERNQIEVSPLAYMRGRTLDDAFIILDEAQNTTQEQMKMFLTRLGNNSRAVITGDITQIDLGKDKKSGLVHVGRILHNVKGISFVNLDRTDVVRNPLVSRIIAAYEDNQKQRSKA